MRESAANESVCLPRRSLKTSSEGFQQSYNAQIAVEGENQLVVAAAVTRLWYSAGSPTGLSACR